MLSEGQLSAAAVCLRGGRPEVSSESARVQECKRLPTTLAVPLQCCRGDQRGKSGLGWL